MDKGDDSRAVQRQQTNVQNIQAIWISWGDPDYDGDSTGRSSTCKHRCLHLVHFLRYVAMEGHSGWGEDSSIVSEQLGRCSTFKNVQRLQESWAAFAAVLVDGFVVAAGHLLRPCW